MTTSHTPNNGANFSTNRCQLSLSLGALDAIIVGLREAVARSDLKGDAEEWAFLADYLASRYEDEAASLGDPSAGPVAEMLVARPTSSEVPA